jgi:hypothetical protein
MYRLRQVTRAGQHGAISANSAEWLIARKLLSLNIEEDQEPATFCRTAPITGTARN